MSKWRLVHWGLKWDALWIGIRHQSYTSLDAGRVLLGFGVFALYFDVIWKDWGYERE